MKRIFLTLFIALSLPLTMLAEQTLSELVTRLNTAQRDGDYLEALVAASAILKQDNNHRVAKDFVHNYYQRMDMQSKEHISEIAFSNDAAELEEICEIYRKLSEINENLSEVNMPLRGGNRLTGEWTWQPELQYYRGHYDKARTRVFQMYCGIAKAAVKEHHFEAAYTYYQKALKTYLMAEEYPTQLKEIVSQCREMADIDSRSIKTDELVRAYHTFELIEQLDPSQTEIAPLKQQLMPSIAQSYIKDADNLIDSDLVTDWELAYEYLQTALDWDEKEEKQIVNQSSTLRQKIYQYYISHDDERTAKRWQDN